MEQFREDILHNLIKVYSEITGKQRKQVSRKYGLTYCNQSTTNLSEYALSVMSVHELILLTNECIKFIDYNKENPEKYREERINEIFHGELIWETNEYGFDLFTVFDNNEL